MSTIIVLVNLGRRVLSWRRNFCCHDYRNCVHHQCVIIVS